MLHCPIHSEQKSLRELKKIKIAWPGLDYATPAGVLDTSTIASVRPVHGSSGCSLDDCEPLRFECPKITLEGGTRSFPRLARESTGI